MPYQMLCNSVQGEGIKASPGLASWLFCYAPLHNNRYRILSMPLSSLIYLGLLRSERKEQAKSRTERGS